MCVISLNPQKKLGGRRCDLHLEFLEQAIPGAPFRARAVCSVLGRGGNADSEHGGRGSGGSWLLEVSVVPRAAMRGQDMGTEELSE